MKALSVHEVCVVEVCVVVCVEEVCGDDENGKPFKEFENSDSKKTKSVRKKIRSECQSD